MILALETSGKSGSAAVVLPDGNILTQATSPDLGSAQTLAVVIRELLSREKIAVSSLRAIATTVGPGSFTGLRVGVSIAKTMAYGLGIPTIAIDTLEALAYQISERFPSSNSQLWTLLDAYRGELFAASWKLEANLSQPRLVSVKQSHLMNCQEFARQWIKNDLDELSLSGSENNSEESVFAGPGLSRLKDLERHFQSYGEKNPIWLPEAKPDARDVGLIAFRKLKEGDVTDPFRLMPIYLRSSAAEDKVRTRPAS